MSQDCRLVVLAGAHSGAEVALDDGVYLLGSDLGCDVVLLDSGVSARHLRLTVQQGRVSIERLVGSQALLHGVPVGAVLFKIVDKDEVAIGTAVLGFRGVAEPLPDPVPPAPEAVPAPEPESPESMPPGPDPLPEEAPIDLDDGTPTLEIVDETGAAPAPEVQAVPAPRQRLHPLVWGLPLAVVVIGLGAFAGSKALQASAPLRAPDARLAVPAKQFEARDQLVARVREFLGDDRLSVQRDAQGRIVVSGKTQAKVVKQQIADIKNEFKQTIEIVDRVTYVSDNKPHSTIRLPQRITDIYVGEEMRWFQTADGMRNFEGSVLEDGAEVVRINIDGIVFRKDGKLAIFKLTDEEQSK